MENKVQQVCWNTALIKNFQNKKLLGHLLKTGLNSSHKSMRISSYYVCSFCAVNQWSICSVWYEIVKCYMQTTILHIHSAEEVRPKAKSQVKLKPKSQPKPKAKWACKWKILAPKCSQKPEATSRRSQKPKSNQKKGQQKYPSPLHKGCTSKQYPPWYVLTKWQQTGMEPATDVYQKCFLGVRYASPAPITSF